jgi:undecaprenyl-diphosphatase
LPPPAPFKPFVLLAGIAEISVAKFATAILIGRGARYLIEGLLALWYGERAIAYIREHGVEVAATAVVVVLAGFIVYLWWPRARHPA